MNTCSFEGCKNKNNMTAGLCGSHYNQKLAGKELKPLRQYKKGLHQDSNGRVCTSCETYKKWSEFYSGKAVCKACFIDRQLDINARLKRM